MKKIITIFIACISCTNAQVKQVTTIGNYGHIKCFSGGQLIYEGDSTGKIATEENSDGWFFEEKGSNKLIRISGDCIIIN